MLALPHTEPSNMLHLGWNRCVLCITRGTRLHCALRYIPRERLKLRQCRNYAISTIIGTIAVAYGSVPLYKMVEASYYTQRRLILMPGSVQICQTTGWSGQPIRSATHGGDDDVDSSARLNPVEGAPRIRITFASSVSDVLPWKFVPQQREVRIRPGETALYGRRSPMWNQGCGC